MEYHIKYCYVGCPETLAFLNTDSRHRLSFANLHKKGTEYFMMSIKMFIGLILNKCNIKILYASPPYKKFPIE